MKFNVELLLERRYHARKQIEADSPESAQRIAEELGVGDVKTWIPIERRVHLAWVMPVGEYDNAETRIAPHDIAGMPTEVREALNELIGAYYDINAEDYETLPRSQQIGHPFEAILTVARWLYAASLRQPATQ